MPTNSNRNTYSNQIVRCLFYLNKQPPDKSIFINNDRILYFSRRQKDVENDDTLWPPLTKGKGRKEKKKKKIHYFFNNHLTIL